MSLFHSLQGKLRINVFNPIIISPYISTLNKHIFIRMNLFNYYDNHKCMVYWNKFIPLINKHIYMV